MWLNGMGDDNLRPDRLGVMIDCQHIRLGDREVGKVHFWEIRPGALDQPIIRNIAEHDKDEGFVVVYHRMLSENTYEEVITMRQRHFTTTEFETLRTGG